MNAIILAGGYGTRLSPLTNSTPKPMLPICNRPIIDYAIAQLTHFGIRDVVFTLAYKPDQIIDWASGYANLNTHFVVENTPLGTLGGVMASAEFLDDTFIVLSGDGISDINLKALLNRHLANKCLVTAVVKKCDSPALYGVASLNKNGKIDGFIEKPHNITDTSYINCGAYVVNKTVFDLVKSEIFNIQNDENQENLAKNSQNSDKFALKGGSFSQNGGSISQKSDNFVCDFARDLFPILTKMGKLGYYIHNGYWQDVGDIKSYYQTNFDLLKAIQNQDLAKGKSGFNESDLGGGVFYPRAYNAFDNLHSSKLFGNNSPSLINQSAKKNGTAINSIIDKNVEIERGGMLDSCIVLPHTTINSRHFGCIISNDFCIDTYNLNPPQTTQPTHSIHSD